jgi:ribosomal subunit interface protein
MKLQINAGDVELTDAIREHITESVEQAMKHHADRITRVEVHLHDEASKRAAAKDKKCTVEVRLAGMQPLAVEYDSDDLYDAIKQAARKAHRAVEHKLDRHDGHTKSH